MSNVVTKRIPQRMCCACRGMKDKSALLRIVRSTDGTIKLDFTSKADGRGAYICDSETCIQRAVKTKVFNKVFATDVDEAIYDYIRNEYSKHKKQN